MARTIRSQNSLITMMACGLAAIIVIARATPAQSNPDVTPWTSPIPIATGLPEASRPALVSTVDGVQHAAWESEGKIYYTSQTAGQGWLPPRELPPVSPRCWLADHFERLHIVFANQFMANYEIYEVSALHGADWSWPVNVSHTSGFSAFPVATAGANGALYVAWMDNSPGYWMIYLGTWKGAHWSSRPVPNARGQAPVLASVPDGTLYLAWQDRVPTADKPTGGAFDIFLSEYDGVSWSLPVNVSDRASVESIGVHLDDNAERPGPFDLGR